MRIKEAELREDYPGMDPDQLRQLSLEDAQEAFNVCLKSLQRSADYLKISVPLHARISGAFPPMYSRCTIWYSNSLGCPSHQEDISELVKVTRDIVKERVKRDAWAIAQGASLPLKIEASVTYVLRQLSSCLFTPEKQGHQWYVLYLKCPTARA